MQIGGVIYADAPTKPPASSWTAISRACRSFSCRTCQGFMVGKQAEQAGIIRAGAKLVNVVSNSVVPKLTVIIGGSFGAGNYALCGKAYDPALILAWPSRKYAVMGADQAAETVLASAASRRQASGQNAHQARDRRTSRIDSPALRRANRHPLRRGPRLGRRDHPPARDSPLAANRTRLVAANLRRRRSEPACCRCEMSATHEIRSHRQRPGILGRPHRCGRRDARARARARLSHARLPGRSLDVDPRDAARARSGCRLCPGFCRSRPVACAVLDVRRPLPLDRQRRRT